MNPRIPAIAPSAAARGEDLLKQTSGRKPRPSTASWPASTSRKACSCSPCPPTARCCGFDPTAEASASGVGIRLNLGITDRRRRAGLGFENRGLLGLRRCSMRSALILALLAIFAAACRRSVAAARTSTIPTDGMDDDPGAAPDPDAVPPPQAPPRGSAGRDVPGRGHRRQGLRCRVRGRPPGAGHRHRGHPAHCQRECGVPASGATPANE